ncbi:MAG: KH domain-containing protein [Clostridia bacterium]|nr:KH domain-containing protein [Clostridia bacterium]
MEESVKQLIKFVVETFAENKQDVEYVINENENCTEVTVLLNPSDMGKVIGKQGKIAKALRTLVSASTPRGAKRCTVEIKEKV